MCKSKAVDDYRHIKSVTTDLERALGMLAPLSGRATDVPVETVQAALVYIRGAREELIALAESM